MTASPDLILASKSQARQTMLRQAGYDFDVVPADIDEDEFKGGEVEGIAQTLADQKALFISKQYKDKYIIGSDQILVYNNEILSKAGNKKEAIDKIKSLSGQTHHLISAVSVYKNYQSIFQYQDKVSLTMRDLSEGQIHNYIEQAGDVVTQCVGGYALEGLGIRLFEKIKGDYFTILGMPLLPLIQFLNHEGFEL